MSPNHLRTLSEYHSGLDLVERMKHAEGVVAQQAEGLRWAAEEIERLQARVKELEQE